MDRRDTALVTLGKDLRERGYRFTTITPLSHARVNGRPSNAQARNVADSLGWSRPFDPDMIPSRIINLLTVADALSEADGLLYSNVRFSTAGNQLFVHSAFPTVDSDSVFFGPDTYRYLSLLRRLAPHARCAVDVGCGSGAGGIAVAASCERVLLTDINARALRYAAVNAAINGVTNAIVLESNILHEVDTPFDLVISNPPYLVDEHARLYRDGGGRFGEGLSIEIVRQSLQRLPARGRLILYTASAISDGTDPFRAAIDPLLGEREHTYEELDPDVFGEELDRPAYGSVDRLAVVALDVAT
ncbi:MAG: SAM-dependent methyltransferase [Acidobacteria bacterium]|nr:SAM-dependent methyltransferase [Acidobacteriota bacterium]